MVSPDNGRSGELLRFYDALALEGAMGTYEGLCFTQLIKHITTSSLLFA